MTSYFSLAFLLVFLPVSVAVYSVAPKRARWAVLLIASYIFFWCVSGALIAFIVASTLVVYACGLGMSALLARRDAAPAQDRAERKKIKQRYKRHMRCVLALGVGVNIALLVSLKYLGFFSGVVCSLLSLIDIEATPITASIGVPIGISFYTLMAISYLADVYRETTPADRHLGSVALFLSFFPQIMEGPICRYSQTAFALTEGKPISSRNAYEGFVRILFGLAKKFIVADRLNPFIKQVFDNYPSHDGSIVAIAAVLYTIQLYCDFSGTMDIAIGIGRIFNVNMPENFRQPFFSRTASEFWKRWHITLGTWFKDYVYYPVSLSRPCKRLAACARKKLGVRYGPLLASSVALLCVWVGNGLWHGAGSQYLFFGIYYFVMILGGGLIEPIAQSAAAWFNVNRDSIPYRAFQIIRTLGIVFVGELFFRANSMQAGLDMFAAIATRFSFDPLAQGAVLSLGVDLHDFAIVAIMLAVMLMVGILKERGVDLCAAISARGAIVRWGTVIGLFLSIVIFGAYGGTYAPVDPMYAQF